MSTGGKIESASLDSNAFQLAAFGLLDGLKILVQGSAVSDSAADGAAAEEKKEDGAAADGLVNKCDVNAVDDRGCTPLVWASR